jgi:hypothetical protein
VSKKHWIEDAIKKPGSFSAAAKRAGKSTAEYAHKKDSAPGVTGKRARLAEVLEKVRKK